MPRFSLILMDHFEAPRNFGRFESPDAVGQASLDGESPRVTFYLRLAGGIVERATYETAGCGVAIAACSMLSVIATSRPIADCLGLTADDLDAVLGGVPVEKKYCLNLAIEALRDALSATESEDQKPLAKGVVP